MTHTTAEDVRALINAATVHAAFHQGRPAAIAYHPEDADHFADVYGSAVEAAGIRHAAVLWIESGGALVVSADELDQPAAEHS